jgi:hypothetical protein
MPDFLSWAEVHELAIRVGRRPPLSPKQQEGYIGWVVAQSEIRADEFLDLYVQRPAYKKIRARWPMILNNGMVAEVRDHLGIPQKKFHPGRRSHKPTRTFTPGRTFPRFGFPPIWRGVAVSAVLILVGGAHQLIS